MPAQVSTRNRPAGHLTQSCEDSRSCRQMLKDALTPAQSSTGSSCKAGKEVSACWLAGQAYTGLLMSADARLSPRHIFCYAQHTRCCYATTAGSCSEPVLVGLLL
jgi:hypothetical protein